MSSPFQIAQEAVERLSRSVADSSSPSVTIQNVSPNGATGLLYLMLNVLQGANRNNPESTSLPVAAKELPNYAVEFEGNALQLDYDKDKQEVRITLSSPLSRAFAKEQLLRIKQILLNPERKIAGFRSDNGVPNMPISFPAAEGSIQYMVYNFPTVAERNYFRSIVKGIAPAYGFTDEYYAIQFLKPPAGMQDVDRLLFLRKDTFDAIRNSEMDIADNRQHFRG